MGNVFTVAHYFAKKIGKDLVIKKNHRTFALAK
jgi:hypothetical protein